MGREGTLQERLLRVGASSQRAGAASMTPCLSAMQTSS